MSKFVAPIVILVAALTPASALAAPVAPEVSSNPLSGISAPQHTFTWTDTPSNQYQCQLDSSPVVCGTGTWTSNPGLINGDHIFRVRMSDDTGATWSEWGTATFKVAPVPPTISKVPDPELVLPYHTFKWAPADDMEYQCKVDDEDVSCSDGSYTSDIDLSEGDHTFTLQQSDDSGDTWSSVATALFKTGPITSDSQVAFMLGQLVEDMHQANMEDRFQKLYAGMYVKRWIEQQCGARLTESTDPQVQFLVRQAYITSIWNGLAVGLLKNHQTLIDKIKALPAAVTQEKKDLVAQLADNEQTMHDQLVQDSVSPTDLCSALNEWKAASWVDASKPTLFTNWWSNHVDAWKTGQWMPKAQYNEVRSWLQDVSVNETAIHTLSRHGWKWQAKAALKNWAAIDPLISKGLADRDNLNLNLAPVFGSNNGAAPTELHKYDIVEGSGTAAVKSGDRLAIRYRAALYSDGTVFDEKWSRPGSSQFTVGSTALPAGVSQGIIGMKVGGRRHMVLPANLAFGSNGFEDKVPADATVVYVVDLVKIGSSASTPTNVKPAKAPRGSKKIVMRVEQYASSKLASYHMQTVLLPGWRFQNWQSKRTGFSAIKKMSSTCDLVLEVSTRESRDYESESANPKAYVDQDIRVAVKPTGTLGSGYINNVRRGLGGITWNLLGQWKAVGATYRSSGSKRGYYAVAGFAASSKSSGQYYRTSGLRISLGPNVYNSRGCRSSYVMGRKNTILVMIKNARLVS